MLISMYAEYVVIHVEVDFVKLAWTLKALAQGGDYYPNGTLKICFCNVQY